MALNAPTLPPPIPRSRIHQQLHVPAPQRQSLARIIGAEGLSDEEIALKLTEGGRLVSYQYCISVVVLTFRRSSDLHLLKPGESGFSRALPYACISLFCGWWGIP